MIEFNRAAAGIVIKRIRNERKLSQEVFSGLAGIARSHLAMIENGAKQANFETIWRIANAFDMPPHILVKHIEKEATNENNPRST
ncbi:MAG: helix-turn-helix transcriptional regulator [Oscillospiraceae bacterium]|nr:helix-turn-helix transcriptional regulator [Oscillospiraceae bacterium]